jgi:hypothetical protein
MCSRGWQILAHMPLLKMCVHLAESRAMSFVCFTGTTKTMRCDFIKMSWRPVVCPYAQHDVAGKLLAAAPWGQPAVDLQRALAKVLTTCLSLQPPAPSTAVHVLEVLRDSEAKARQVPGAQGQQFITFDDTFIIYSELLAHRMGTSLRQLIISMDPNSSPSSGLQLGFQSASCLITTVM